MNRRYAHQDIQIGLCLPFAHSEWSRWVTNLGFESISLTHGGPLDEIEWEDEIRFAQEVATVNSVGVYWNTFESPSDMERLLKGLAKFGINTLGCFTGADPNQSVEENLPQFRKVWGPLAKIAEGEGVRLAFENCPMGGDWARPISNLAFCPRAWEMLFNAVPSKALGLEWEPAHQLCAFADIWRQLDKWHQKIFHIHAKDALVLPDRLAEHGIYSGVYAVEHRLPGFGSTNWAHLFGRLRQLGWEGSMDIESYHDTTMNRELEATGWVAALKYLRQCRGGEYVAMPQD